MAHWNYVTQTRFKTAKSVQTWKLYKHCMRMTRMCACVCVHSCSTARAHVLKDKTRSTNEWNQICRQKKDGHLMMIIIMVHAAVVVVVIVAISITSSSSFHHENFCCRCHRCLFLLLLLQLAHFTFLSYFSAAVNKNCSSHKTYYLIFVFFRWRETNAWVDTTNWFLFLLFPLLLSLGHQLYYFSHHQRRPNIVGAFKCMLVCNLHLDRCDYGHHRHSMQFNLCGMLRICA